MSRAARASRFGPTVHRKWIASRRCLRRPGRRTWKGRCFVPSTHRRTMRYFLRTRAAIAWNSRVVLQIRKEPEGGDTNSTNQNEGDCAPLKLKIQKLRIL